MDNRSTNLKVSESMKYSPPSSPPRTTYLPQTQAQVKEILDLMASSGSWHSMEETILPEPSILMTLPGALPATTTTKSSSGLFGFFCCSSLRLFTLFKGGSTTFVQLLVTRSKLPFKRESLLSWFSKVRPVLLPFVFVDQYHTSPHWTVIIFLVAGNHVKLILRDLLGPSFKPVPLLSPPEGLTTLDRLAIRSASFDITSLSLLSLSSAAFKLDMRSSASFMTPSTSLST
mmetsp:Transcript_20217/g.37719  ORF Transcript_20217/g.37719 Transcript_20217/m.37719 type:complete len:230 (-) Transcript_20217:835-1524(-)